MSFTKGSTGFQNPVIGGDGELVIDSIHSRGYQQGVIGWSINKDGSAEFSDVRLRGDFRAEENDSFIEISNNPVSILFNPDVDVYFDGHIVSAGSNTGEQGQLHIACPYPNNPGTDDPAEIVLLSDVQNTNAGSLIILDAETVRTTHSLNVIGPQMRGPDETTYSPVWSATSGTTALGAFASLTGRYVNGSLINFEIVMTFGAGMSQSVPGAGWRFTLPVPAVSNRLATMRAFDATGNLRYIGSGIINSATGLVENFAISGTPGMVSDTVPFGMSAGDSWIIDGTYPPN